MKTKYLNTVFSALLGLAALVVAPLSLVATANAQEINQKILVISKQRIMIESLAGKEIASQAADLLKVVQAEIIAERDQIEKEENDLKEQFAILTPEQRQAKGEALQLRKAKFNSFAQLKEREYQASIAKAQNEIGKILVPILEEIIAERKATILVDQSQLMFSSPDHDITADALLRIDARLKSVKVERVRAEAKQQAKAEDPKQ